MLVLGSLGLASALLLVGVGFRQMMLDEPVFDAIRRNDARALEAAIKAGGSPNAGAGDDASRSALMTTLYEGKIACAQVLLRYGADPNEESGMSRPLQTAETLKRGDFERLLRRHGAR